MKFNNNFDKREFIAREALKALQKLYPKLFINKIFFTEDKYESFDAYFHLIDKNGSIKKRVWIELKIRDRIFPTYILEKKKLDNLEKSRKKSFMDSDEVVYLYINFTPENTIIWNINKYLKNKTTKLKANKTTSISRQNKITKEVIYLNPDDGIIIPYIINEFKIIRDYENRERKRELNKNTKRSEIIRGIFATYDNKNKKQNGKLHKS